VDDDLRRLLARMEVGLKEFCLRHIRAVLTRQSVVSHMRKLWLTTD
jgi:hypothetical protein